MEKILNTNEQQTKEIWDEFKRNNRRTIKILMEQEGKLDEATVKENIAEKFPELDKTCTQTKRPEGYQIRDPNKPKHFSSSLLLLK